MHAGLSSRADGRPDHGVTEGFISTPFAALAGLLLGSSRTADVLVTEIVKEGN